MRFKRFFSAFEGLCRSGASDGGNPPPLNPNPNEGELFLSSNAAWEAAVEVVKGMWVSLNWSDNVPATSREGVW